MSRKLDIKHGRVDLSHGAGGRGLRFWARRVRPGCGCRWSWLGVRSSGSSDTPTAARAWRPLSPNTSTNRSLAPFATFGCSVKPAADATNTLTFTILPGMATTSSTDFAPSGA